MLIVSVFPLLATLVSEEMEWGDISELVDRLDGGETTLLALISGLLVEATLSFESDLLDFSELVDRVNLRMHMLAFADGLLNVWRSFVGDCMLG